jgi:hypothetical protein
MPEVEFRIDSDTGRLEMHVKGIAGPACDDVAKLARELLGRPVLEQETGEYHLRPRVRPGVRPQRPLASRISSETGGPKPCRS